MTNSANEFLFDERICCASSHKKTNFGVFGLNRLWILCDTLKCLASFSSSLLMKERQRNARLLESNITKNICRKKGETDEYPVELPGFFLFKNMRQWDLLTSHYILHRTGIAQWKLTTLYNKRKSSKLMGSRSQFHWPRSNNFNSNMMN